MTKELAISLLVILHSLPESQLPNNAFFCPLALHLDQTGVSYISGKNVTPNPNSAGRHCEFSSTAPSSVSEI
jgi:hypothetical protein